LAFYQDKIDLLPRSLRFIEHEFLLHLSEAASDLSLGKLAKELAEEYREAVRGDSHREPAGDSGPTQKLRHSEEKFAHAKALWVSGRQEAGFFKDPEGAAKVRKLLNEVGEQSPFSFEREIILSLLDAKEAESKEAKKAGREQLLLKAALVHATNAQLLSPSRGPGVPETLGGATDATLASWVARLEGRIGDPKVALEMCGNLESFLRKKESQESKESKQSGDSLVAVLGMPSVIRLDELLLLKAELLEKQADWGAAAGAYEQAVQAGFNSNRILFGQARALLKTGEADAREKALAILGKFADPKSDDLWKRLASETLSNSEIVQSSLKNQAKEGRQ
jgi:hypothetical protein